MTSVRYANCFVADSLGTTTNGLVSGSMTVNYPAGAKVGDYLIALFSTNDDTFTAASGWTSLRTGTASPWAARLYGKVCTSTEANGGSASWSMSGSNQAPDCAIVWAFRNADSAAIVTSIGTNSTSTSVSTPGLTIAQPSAILHMRALRLSPGGTALTLSSSPGTETEVSNADTVAYSAAGYDIGMQWTTGSVAGQSITASGAPTTSFVVQAAVGAVEIADPRTKNLSAPMRASL